MSKKKPYYPNNWQAFKDAPDEMFCDHTFDELMDWKVAGWELPSSVYCIIRTMDVNTKKVKEYVANPVDTNPDRIEQIQSLAAEHQVDDYLASILYLSKK